MIRVVIFLAAIAALALGAAWLADRPGDVVITWLGYRIETSVMVLLGFVVPQFQQTFAQAGKALPLPTEIVIILGTGLRKYWWLLLIIVVALAWVTRRRLRLPEVRFRWDGRLLRAPLLGDLLAKVEVARFARTLATLLGNGVTLLSGLAITKETMTNSVLAQALDGVVTRLREGKGFGRPLISISRQVKWTPEPSAFPTASLAAKRPA